MSLRTGTKPAGLPGAGLALGMLALMLGLSGPLRAQIRPLFPPAGPAGTEQAGPAGQACPAPPAAIRDQDHVVFYADRSNSVVDRDKWQQTQELTAPLRAFSTEVARMADLYRASRGRRGDLALCVASWIDHWAGERALLGEVSRWGRYNTLWFGQIPLGVAWLKVADSQTIPAPMRGRIGAWLTEVAGVAMAEQNAPPHAGRLTNIRAWTAAAMAVAAVAAQDRPRLDEAIATIRAIVARATPEGALPAEIARGRRAFLYHVWAIEPIALVALIAHQNGIALAEEHDRAIWRVAGLVLRTGKGSKELAGLAGMDQEGVERFPQAWQLGFAEMLLGIGEDPELLALVTRFRPVVSPFTGGLWRVSGPRP